MEVCKHGIGDVTQRGCPGGLRRPRIGAYTQYLGIAFLEIRIGDPERGDLVGSASCEREDVEREDDVLLSQELAESYVFTGMGL